VFPNRLNPKADVSKIHPSSFIDPRARLADDVEIGPWCMIDGQVTIGPGCRLLGRVSLRGPMTIGAGNVFYPNVCIGFEPQDRKFVYGSDGAGTLIGDNNIFREGVTIHRATAERPTTVGNQNMFMVNCHLGHDVSMGNNCTLANGVLIAGHVDIQDSVVIGGNTAVHQFCRLGRLAMLGGACGLTQDVPPFCTVYTLRRVGSLNLVGLRRQNYRQHIKPLQQAFDLLFRSHHSREAAVAAIERQLGSDPLCAEIARFAKSTRRGITPFGRVRDAVDPP